MVATIESTMRTTALRKSARLVKHMSKVEGSVPTMESIEETKDSSIGSQKSGRKYGVGANTKKEVKRNSLTPSDILTQICLAGVVPKPEPGYSFMPSLFNFLSVCRDQICQDNAGSKGGKRKGYVGSKREKRKRADAQQHMLLK